MFECVSFSGLPGGSLAVQLEAADPYRLDDDQLKAYLQAARRLEAWAASRLMHGLCAFAEGHAAPDPDASDAAAAGPGAPDSGASDADGAADPDAPDSDGRDADGSGSRPRARPSGRTLRGLARPVRFGGAGTPMVDEFAAEQLAPILQLAPMTAGAWLGDALDLRARLPWVRTGLRDGTVSWQAARAIASGTRALSLARLDLARVDQRLYASATPLTPGRLRLRIQHVVAQADPDSVDDDARKARRQLYVGFAPQPQAQTTSIFGELDPTGAQRLDQQIAAVARLLRRLDHDSPWEALRARALVLLADTAGLRHLHHRVAALDHAPTGDTPAGSCSGPGRSEGAGSQRPDTAPLPTTVVHIHAEQQVWESGAGAVEVEDYGWVPLWSLTAMLAETRVRVVSSTSDLVHPEHGDGTGHPARWHEPHRHEADPGYQPREHTRDQVAGRDRTCRFPGCNRRARACQSDHTRPWPHGPTCACNLGCLCTRHHRLKTHTRWSLRQPWPGIFLWRSPTGHYWLVDHTGTTELRTDAA